MSSAAAGDRWARPIRRTIVTTVLGAIAGLLLLFGGGVDRAIPVVLVFGALGGAVGGIRFFLLPWGGSGDPRVGGDIDDAPIYEGYALVLLDYLRAVGLWLIGAVPLGVALAVVSHDGTAVWVVPLVLGLMWSLAYGIACLAVGLLAIPVVILVRARRARRRGEPFNPWWYYLAVYLGVLMLGIAAVVVVVLLTPALLNADGGRVIASILTLGTEGLSTAQIVALWTARVLILAMVALMVSAVRLARLRVRELRVTHAAPRGVGPREPGDS